MATDSCDAAQGSDCDRALGGFCQQRQVLLWATIVEASALSPPSRQVAVGGALIAAARNVIAQRRAASPAAGDGLAEAGWW